MSARTVMRTSGRTLLGCGVVAGPLYLLVYAVQGMTREGFDFSRHAGSLLTNGDAGWVQVVNFLVAGALLVSAAVGLRAALPAGPGRTWGPRLLGGYGVGMAGAGIFTADPAFGFPPGTPDGPGQISWHGLMHFTVGGIGFISFVACCLVFARRFARDGRRGWARFSATTGVLFLAAFVGIAAGSGGAGVTLAFVAAIVLSFAWITALSAHFRKDAS